MDKTPMPKPTPWWELPVVMAVVTLIAYLFKYDIFLWWALGLFAFLERYVESERKRWRVVTEVLANTNLARLEMEIRLAKLEGAGAARVASAP